MFDSERVGPLSSAVLRVALPLSLLLVCTGLAVAESKSALSWVREPGTESCIGAVELGQRVERLVGPMLVAAPAGQVSVEGRIARVQHGFHAQIVVSDAHGAVLGTRELDSPSEDCRAIDDKLAFVIAVAIDPNAALAELPGELAQDEDPGGALLAELRAQPPRPAAAAAQVTPAQAQPARGAGRARPPSSARDPFHLRAAIELSLGLGALMEPSIGARPSVALARDDLAFWLHFSAWLPQTQTVQGEQAVRVGSYGMALGVCPLRFGARPWEAWLCAGAGADLLQAQPQGFGREQRRVQFGPELELRAGVALGRYWWLGIGASSQNRWPRHEIGYQLAGRLVPVYRTPLLSGRLSTMLEMRF